MNAQTLFLFLILLFGFVLCCFLGRRNYVEGMNNYDNSTTSTSTFTSSDGTSAVITNENVIVVTNSDGSKTTYVYSETKNTQYGTSTVYNGPNGGSAVLLQGGDGILTIKITGPNGENVTLTSNTTGNNQENDNSNQNNDNSNQNNFNYKANYDNYNHYTQTSYPTIFYGPNGGTARIIQTQNNNTIVTTSKNGTTQIFYIQNGNTDNNNNNNNNKMNFNGLNISTYQGPNGAIAKIITTPNGKQAIAITMPDGSRILYTQDNIYASTSQDETINDTTDMNQYYSPNKEYTSYPNSTSYDSSMYYNSLPQGIPKTQIPPGQEDLYILKSEVVPPVCPACPEPIVQCPDKMDPSTIPPCPPCARCPEPSFDCKKVPNYNAFNPDTMPVPVLNDFSGFGM